MFRIASTFRPIAPRRHHAAASLAGAALLGIAFAAAPVGAQDVCLQRADHDGDTIYSYTECNFGTNPLNPDTDGDGLSDWYEWDTEPGPLVNNNLAPTPQPPVPPAPQGPTDRDGDQLYDEDETGYYGTNPDAWDTDGDGAHDGLEVYNGTDPHDAWDN